MADYYDASGAPGTNSAGDSSVMRAEFTALAVAFAKIAAYTGNADKLVTINGAATGQSARTLAGTNNQITVSIGASTITLATPQDIHAAASPTFAGLTLTGNLSTQGDTAIGNAAGDALTIAAGTVALSNNPTISGNPTFSGNVLISGGVTLGSTTPALNIDATTTGKGQISFKNTTTQKAAIALSGAIEGNSDTHLGLFAESGGAVKVYVGGSIADQMRVSATGFLKASNTGTHAGPTTSRHEIANSVNGNLVVKLEHSGSDPGGMQIAFSGAAPDNNTNYFLECVDSSTTRLFIYADGDVQNHDNSYGAISDERLKQDIVAAGSQWDDVKALRVIKWRDIGDVQRDRAAAKVMIGFGAQQVETVSPGLVIERNGVKGVQYSIANMKLFRAFQEAQQRIEALEAIVYQQAAPGL